MNVLVNRYCNAQQPQHSDISPGDSVDDAAGANVRRTVGVGVAGSSGITAGVGVGS